MAEESLRWAALLAYAAAALMPGRARLLPRTLWLAIALHTLSLSLRWQTLGHGPFTTLHEILSSSLWSLSLVQAVAWWRWPALRCAWRPTAVVLMLLAAWLLATDPAPGHFPPTYDTPLLYLHTVVGKLFLGLLLSAAALGTIPLLRRSAWGRRHLAAAPPGPVLDRLSHGFAASAFVAESLMLIVGAVWAQDAWGRYWDWDPLETWAFATWLALAATLHGRVTFRPRADVQAACLAGVFVIAFLTFFGVPFISLAPHKGAI